MSFRALFFILMFFRVLSTSSAEEKENIPGWRQGYLTTTRNERQARAVDMVLVPRPAPRPSYLPILGRPLLDDKLTKEFQSQYELQFGRTDVERNYNDINKFTFFDEPGSRVESLQAYNQRQRQFGGYMFKRIVEYHVDLYLKSNREIRPIYELKDRLSNVNIPVRQGYKVNVRYSLSGNNMDIKLDNPYEVTSKLTMQMGSGFGSHMVKRTILSLVYPWSKTISYSLFQEVNQSHSTTVVASRQMTSSLTALLTVARDSPVQKDDPLSQPHENLMLIGFSWTE